MIEIWRLRRETAALQREKALLKKMIDIKTSILERFDAKQAEERRRLRNRRKRQRKKS